jgi:hypothetical protein
MSETQHKHSTFEELVNLLGLLVAIGVFDDGEELVKLNHPRLVFVHCVDNFIDLPVKKGCTSSLVSANPSPISGSSSSSTPMDPDPSSSRELKQDFNF